jgi:hypothetical protein
MSLIKDKNDLWILMKSYCISVLFVSSLFCASTYTFSKILENNNVNDDVAVQESDNEKDIFVQFLEKEKITSNVSGDSSSYVIYANTDPVIQKIEIFLSKNKNNLSEEELAKVEKFRSERITYLMAKHYKKIVQNTPHN